MSFGKKEFSFKGRIGRLTYFGLFLLNVVVAIPLVCIGVALVEDNNNPALGMLIVLATVLGGIWTYFALTIKRLHDMGLAGTHVIWIVLLSFAASSFAATTTEPVLGLLLGILNAGTSLWLVFQRGEDHQNRYGNVPGATNGAHVDSYQRITP
jgi:uncharacterized membrane protein YhaH (DUF805 family)